jgi:quercetin dioxygenase-like cupin family protein
MRGRGRVGYAPSPRPNFSKPTHIPYANVTRHLWGDDVAGRVADWIYVSSEEIHQLIFGLPQGGAFLHSDAFRTVFAADEVLYVLEGTMVLANPETGEVQRLPRGDAAFFRRDTWHHVFNHDTKPLRVLEFFAPPPSQGTSGSYSQTKPNITVPKYTRDELLGHWPLTRPEAERSPTIHALRENDLLWRLEGENWRTLVGLLIATENLTVGKIRLLPGERTDLRSHGGDMSLYVLDGLLNVFTPDKADGQRWFELEPKDGFYLPHGTPHEFHNITSQTTEFIFGVAPGYLQGE